MRVSSAGSSRASGLNVSGSQGARLVAALVMIAIALFSYFGSSVYNPVTEEDQHINITPEQEVAIGLQAVPEMTAEFGGESRDTEAQALVDRIGAQVVADSAAANTEYPFEFHVLGDKETINAFALPGGQVFITEALLSRLETEGEIAGVLGHEVGHVVGRHGAEQIAQAQLAQGLTGAFVMATYDPNDPSTANSAQIAQIVSQLVQMKFSRSDELEADSLGVRFMSESDYDPRALIQVMQVLESASQGNSPPEFFSTHPNPENRISEIEQEINEEFPGGVPNGLTP